MQSAFVLFDLINLLQKISASAEEVLNWTRQKSYFRKGLRLNFHSKQIKILSCKLQKFRKFEKTIIS